MHDESSTAVALALERSDGRTVGRSDGRTAFLPAETETLTGAMGVAAAVSVARQELEHGRLFHVCAYCLTAALRSALARFRNASHGICLPCLTRVTTEDAR